jgi:uncharacterized membrane protein
MHNGSTGKEGGTCMKQNRLKSKVVWLAVLAQLVIIAQITGVLTISQVEVINVSATAVIQILVLLGILNVPTDADNF